MAAKTQFSFTDKAIAALPPHDAVSPSKCGHVTDPLVKGHSVQITKSGQKTFWFSATVAGKKRHHRLGTFGAINVAQAREMALKMRASLDVGGNPFLAGERLKAMPLFRDFADQEYMPYAREHKRSANDDASKLRLHLYPAFGEMRLCDIAQRDIDIYLAKIAKSHSNATANRHRALLSKIFKLAVTWGRLEKNPCTGTQKFKEIIKHQNFLTVEQARRVITAAQQDQNPVAGALVQALLLAGNRREEMAQARWEYLDIERGTLFLPSTKAGKSRYVILNDAALKLLSSQPRVEGSPWIFPGRDPQKPINNPRKAFLRILKAAGVDAMRIHDLRHSFCSLLVSQGVSLYQVQQLVGHASPQTTQRYAHLAADGLRAASQRVAEVVELA